MVDEHSPSSYCDNHHNGPSAHLEAQALLGPICPPIPMQSQPLVVKENNLKGRKYVVVSVESKRNGCKAVVLRCFSLFTFMVAINCFRPKSLRGTRGKVFERCLIIAKEFKFTIGTALH